jgi:hypothetical protein
MAKERMLVEGVDDKYAIAELLGHHIVWDPPPVDIVNRNGDEIFTSGTISAELKSSPKVGVVVDADTNPIGRFQRIRNEALPLFPSIPDEPPSEGMIVTNAKGSRFGIWLMPDNRQDGMIETFLHWLVPGEQTALWNYAQDAAIAAKETHGAPFISAHLDKARIHTFLAWVDPPGENLGRALKRKVLNAKSDRAIPFVRWFRRLYEL